MKSVVKYLMFILLMLVLMLPAFERFYHFFPQKPLKGAVENAEKPVFSFDAYWNATFQDSMNVYIEQNIGFRPSLVRLFNQFRYSVFEHISARGVVEGNDGYLFELSYIEALYGLDFVGHEKINEDVRKTRHVLDWLHTQNKQLFVVLAPGKATFFQEFVPEKFKPDTIGLNNYEEYYAELKTAGIPVIGCNEWFLGMKDTAAHALYPKSGIHWSFYGLGLVMDSVFSSIEANTAFVLPAFRMDQLVETDELRPPDQDIWEGMNIFFTPDDYPMVYPEFMYEAKPDQVLPHVITIADSYYWQWIGFAGVLKSFRTNHFWYYNASITEAGTGKVREREDVDLLLEVLSADIIMILQTDANMNRYSFGFIEQLYDLITKVSHAELERMIAIREIAINIRNSKTYMTTIREKALKRGVSEDEMLLLDAGWIYDQKHPLN